MNAAEGKLEKKHEREIVITIDDTPYTVDRERMTGAELKALAGRPDSYQIFLERPGEADKLIRDDESIELKEGQHFHTVPPAQFG